MPPQRVLCSPELFSTVSITTLAHQAVGIVLGIHDVSVVERKEDYRVRGTVYIQVPVTRANGCAVVSTPAIGISIIR
jgi:hypothetical protein